MAKEKPPQGEPTRHRGRRRGRGTRNEALGATPPTVVSIFAHAQATGDVGRQKQFYKDCRVLDSRLDQVSAKRAGALAGVPLVFKPPPGFSEDREAKRAADMCTRLWNSTPRTVDAIQHLGHAHLEGDAGLAQRWVIDRATGLHRPEFLIEQSHSSLFVYDVDTFEPWYNGLCGPRPSEPTNDAFPLSSRPDSFIFYSPIAGRADDPWRRGALRACVIRSLLKRMNIGHWSALLERWGQPQVVATIDYEALNKKASTEDAEAEADAIADEINEALADMGRDWRASVPKGVEIKEIAVAVAENLHKHFIDWAATEDAIAVLGQPLTTESAGAGFAATSAHRRVEHEIVRVDAMGMGEALTHGWAEPVVRYNMPGAPIPFAEFVVSPQTAWTLQDVQAGVCSVDEYRAGKGQDAEPNGRGRRYLAGGAPDKGGRPATNDGVEPTKPSDTGEPGPKKSEESADPVPTESAKPKGEAGAAGDASEVDVGAGAKLADAALNGAQMAALELVVTKVEDGLRSKETAVELITAEFATIPVEKARAIMNTITPRTQPATNAPTATPAPAPSDGEG